MEHIETLLSTENTSSSEPRSEGGYAGTNHIVEWHIETDTDDMAEGALDGCGGCGCF